MPGAALRSPLGERLRWRVESKDVVQQVPLDALADDLLRTAARGPMSRCELTFLAALRKLESGDCPGGIAAPESCVGTGMHRFGERRFARALLARAARSISSDGASSGSSWTTPAAVPRDGCYLVGLLQHPDYDPSAGQRARTRWGKELHPWLKGGGSLFPGYRAPRPDLDPAETVCLQGPGTITVLDLQRGGEPLAAWNIPADLTRTTEGPAVSPDLRWVACAMVLPPTESLVLVGLPDLPVGRSETGILARGLVVPAQGTLGWRSPAWSPDGTRLACVRCVSGLSGQLRGDLWTASVAGGSWRGSWSSASARPRQPPRQPLLVARRDAHRLPAGHLPRSERRDHGASSP